MKNCPFCAEEIQDAAVKCKHCGSELNATTPHSDEEKKLLYDGSPSWRAYFASTVLILAAAPTLGGGAFWLTGRLERGTLERIFFLLLPFLVSAALLGVLTLVRRSVRVRMTNRGVEIEAGVLSKRIDVLELWRIRDVRYKQSLMDRILGIAHIEIFTKDVTTPHLEVVGLPASRQLFESLRDAIEIQRQSKRVMGLVD